MPLSVLRSFPFLAAVWGASELALMLFKRSAPASSRDRNSLRLMWLAICGGIIGAVLAAQNLSALALPGRGVVLPLSLALFAAGIIIRIYSIIYLGRSFTTNVAITSGQKLVDSGPYKYVRHPSYTGALMTFLSFGLFFCNAASLLIMVVPIYAAFFWRIHVEEEALLGAFGDAYKEYMARTKRLVPGIY